MPKVLIAAVVALTCSCATAFMGSAKVETGRNGCEAKCAAVGMKLSGMVFMGEYTDGCICELERPAGSVGGGASGGAGAAAAGVMMQMQRQQAQAAQTYRR